MFEFVKIEKEEDFIKMVIGNGVEIIILGLIIVLVYFFMLWECEVYCCNEGVEVKCLGGFYVIGIVLYEFWCIDN